MEIGCHHSWLTLSWGTSFTIKNVLCKTYKINSGYYKGGAELVKQMNWQMNLRGDAPNAATFICDPLTKSTRFAAHGYPLTFSATGRLADLLGLRRDEEYQQTPHAFDIRGRFYTSYVYTDQRSLHTPVALH